MEEDREEFNKKYGINKKVEELFQSGQHFISSWGTNPKKTLKYIVRNMKVVPYNIERILEDFCKSLMTSQAD